jgi:phospholipid transport system substrate-binding protein
MLVALSGTAIPVEAAPSAPTDVVRHLDSSLLDVMQNAKQLGFKGRYARLDPLVRETFNIRLMTEIAVGSGWSTLTEEQQNRLADAFGSFIAATYADRFDGYSGEKFQETGERPYGAGTLVETKLVRTDGEEPVTLDYVTRQTDGDWRVVDVFLTGTISELAQRRSEFSSVFRTQGYDGLLQRLQDKTQQIARQAQLS